MSLQVANCREAVAFDEVSEIVCICFIILIHLLISYQHYIYELKARSWDPFPLGRSI